MGPIEGPSFPGDVDWRNAGRYLLGILALFVVYLAAAKVGLLFARVSEVVTPLWPPAGVGIAALILWGFRMWPGVLLGAAGSDFLAGIHPTVSVSTGLANTLESLAAVYLFLRVFKGRKELDRMADVLAFLLSSALACSASASLGAAAYALGGVAAPGTYAEVWLTWWLGDIVGALVGAPLILACCRKREGPEEPASGLKLITVAGSSAAVAWLAFSGPFARANYPLAHLAVLVVALAAFWFGQFGALLVVAALTAAALWATVHSFGPFGPFGGNTALVLSQIYVSVLAISGLIFAALRSETAEAFRRMQAQHRELARLDLVKEHLLSSLSHEIKTPLSLIKGHAELLEDRLPDAPEVQGILDGADRLASHVDQIITYSALVSGTVKLYPADMPVQELVEYAAAATAKRCESRQVDLRVEIDPAAPIVHGDSRLLSRLLAALLDNACKFSPPRGRVEVSAGRSGGFYQISVTDQGPGIAPADLERIWRPFEQLELGSAARLGGIGLGLAISREISRLHDGEIVVESAPGSGSRFTFRMPAESKAEQAEQNPG